MKLAHTVDPHSLSPVLGATNPLAPNCSNSESYSLHHQATFQASKNHDDPMPVVYSIKCNTIESL